MKFNNKKDIENHVMKYGKGTKKQRDVDLITDIHINQMTYEQAGEKYNISKARVGQVLWFYSATMDRREYFQRTISEEQIKKALEKEQDKYHEAQKEAQIMYSFYVDGKSFIQVSDKYGLKVNDIRNIIKRWVTKIRGLTNRK